MCTITFISDCSTYTIRSRTSDLALDKMANKIVTKYYIHNNMANKIFPRWDHAVDPFHSPAHTQPTKSLL